MTSRIHLFSHFGEPEITVEGVDTTPRSWVLNGYGRNEFTIPMSHDAANLRCLEFGNLVHVEHIPLVDEDGVQLGKLPDWTGVILTPRTWDDGMIHVTAYSLEALLAYRAVPFINVSGAPDVLFNQIVRLANRILPPLPFNIGQVDTALLSYSDTLRTNIYDHTKRLADTAQMEWQIVGSISPESHALQVSAELVQRGIMQQDFALTPENTESQPPLLTEQGTIINRIYAYSQANTDADRIMHIVELPDSIARFGPLEANKIYTGVTDDQTLADIARSRTANGDGYPRRLFKRVALDKGRTFDYLRVGNLLYVSDPRVGFAPGGGFGFSAWVRILSMDYNDTSDKVNMNVEIFDDSAAPVLELI